MLRLKHCYIYEYILVIVEVSLEVPLNSFVIHLFYGSSQKLRRRSLARPRSVLSLFNR